MTLAIERRSRRRVSVCVCVGGGGEIQKKPGGGDWLVAVGTAGAGAVGAVGAASSAAVIAAVSVSVAVDPKHAVAGGVAGGVAAVASEIVAVRFVALTHSYEEMAVINHTPCS